MTKINEKTKKRGFILLFFAFMFIKVFAQQTILTGAIVIGKAEVMSYKISYQLNGNKLTGYSLADLNGKEETKASITGYYNAKNKILNFEEQNIVVTKSQIPSDEFCLMNVSGKLEKKNGKLIYTGKFQAKSGSSDVVCDSGSIILLSEKTVNELSALADKAIKKSHKSGEKNVIPNETQLPTPSVRSVYELSAGSETQLEIKSDIVYLDIVDDRFQDGDKISLLKNNIPVVSGFEITNQVKTFRFPIEKEEKLVTFTIIAEDEGSIALTTVKASLRNGNEVNLMMVSLNKGESAKIVLKR